MNISQAANLKDERYSGAINRKRVTCLHDENSTRTFQMTHPEFHEDSSLSLYGHGNASDEIRQEILEQLEYFKEGYLQRDTTIMEVYMDWLDWGDVNLQVDSSNISGGDSIAWFSMTGKGRGYASHLSSGVYLLVFKGKDISESRKFIKQ